MTTLDPAGIIDSVGTGSLSGGNLTLSSTGYSYCPATTSKTSGKHTFQVTVSSPTTATLPVLLFTDQAAPNNLIGVQWDGTQWQIANNDASFTVNGASSPVPDGSYVATVDVDVDAQTVSVRIDGTNVFTDEDVSATGFGEVFAGVIATNASVIGFTQTSTIAFSGLTHAPQSGYSEWDAGGGGSSYTLTAAKGTFTTTGQAANLLLGPYWTFVGQTEAAVNASGNYTISIPAGVQQNDVLVVDIAARGTVIYTNAGFTFPQSDTGGNTTNNTTGSDTSFQTGYCIRGVSNPSTTFARTGGSRALGTMRAYRSSRAGTPSFDTSAKLAMASAGTALTLSGGVTTTGIDELITTGVYGARATTVSNMDGTTEVTGASGSTDTTTPPVFGTWTERSDRNNGTSPTVGLAVFDVIKRTAGSTGNLTATESLSALHGMTAMAFKHPTASGSPYTLTAGKGTFAITGVAAGLKRAFTLGAATGSFSISGQTAGLRVARKVISNVGPFTITGQSAGLVRTAVVAAEQGTFSLSGQSAGLTVGKKIAASTGTFVINGQSVNLNRTYAVAANTGTFAITGQTAGLRVGHGITAFGGSYAITGQSATLRHNSVVPVSTGSYSITGYPATLVYTPAGTAYTLVADTGSVVIDGQSVNLRKDSRFTALTGVYTIDGQPTGLQLSRKVSAGLGIYDITGQSANLVIGGSGAYTLDASTGVYLINGNPANLNYNFIAGGLFFSRNKSWVQPREAKVQNPTIREAAAQLASAGGNARAASLTSAQRVKIATMAARARWR